jgi:biopolymer transport protein ExbB/TolQ
MCWYSADSMTSLGMIGTVVGFLMMLGTAFSGLNLGDTVSAQKAISQMAVGISTALVTTLVGLVCSQITKFILINLEQLINEKENTPQQ